ncbi:MAG: hypothetical protein KJO07_04585 [Deltaproteobacteria bacterium]|nr:hypothetical protein [Deltaproteobacteria bacterium]
MQHATRLILLGAVLGLVLTHQHGTAEAAKPERVFAGKIITAKKRIPTSAKSANAYIRKLKKLRKKKFWEDKKKKEWRIYFAAFFKRPLNDLEITVKFYDVTTGQKHMIASFEQYLEGRGQRSLISKAVLERKFFGVNKKIYMTVENRGRVLASTVFHILGKAPKYTGKVDFTEDEEKPKKSKKKKSTKKKKSK